MLLWKTRFESKVNANIPFVALEGELAKGNYLLKSNFIDMEEKYIPSYYIEILKN